MDQVWAGILRKEISVTNVITDINVYLVLIAIFALTISTLSSGLMTISSIFSFPTLVFFTYLGPVVSSSFLSVMITYFGYIR